MRKRLLLIALVILTLGVIGTGLSTLYERNEWIGSQDQSSATFKVSYGFPMAWHGYSQSYSLYVPPLIYPPKTYWFSLGSLLLDAVFWFAISFFICVAAVKLESILRKTAASKIVFVNMVLAYFFSSLTFMVGGIYLFSVTQNFEGFVVHPYIDLGLRLCDIELFLVAATFYQSLAKERKRRKGSRFYLWCLRRNSGEFSCLFHH